MIYLEKTTTINTGVLLIGKQQPYLIILIEFIIGGIMTIVTKRPGKTRRDKERGVWGNRFKNRQTRVNWQKGENPDGTRQKSTNDNFPTSSCNGKKNRSQTTAKKRKVSP